LAAHLSSEFEEQLRSAYENEAKLAQEAAISANDLRARRIPLDLGQRERLATAIGRLEAESSPSASAELAYQVVLCLG
jgi:hypothetical protein